MAINPTVGGSSSIKRLSTLGKHPSVLIIGHNRNDDGDQDDKDDVLKNESGNNDGQVNHDPNLLSAMVAEFCNTVLGTQASKLAERYRWGNKLLTLVSATAIVLKEHYLSTPWMFASLFQTRIQRFLEAYKSILMALFIDTLIYGIYYPSDGHCESYQTKQTCVVPQAKLGGNQCVWDKGATIPCTPTSPPSDIVSVLILSLVITVLMKPMTRLITLSAKACECRPRFESWSKHWSTNSWIGSLHHASYLDYSPLAMAFMQNEKNKKMENKSLLAERREWGDHDIESRPISGTASPQRTPKNTAPNMEYIQRTLSRVFKQRHPDENLDEFPELDGEDGDDDMVFRLIETMEEEDCITRTCFEQLYSPYEGEPATQPLMPLSRTITSPLVLLPIFTQNTEMKYLLDGAQLTLESHYARSTPHFFESLIHAQAAADEASPGNSARSSVRNSFDGSLRHNSLDPNASHRSSMNGSHRSNTVNASHRSSAILLGRHDSNVGGLYSRKSFTGGEPHTAMQSIEQLQRECLASARAIEHQLGIYSDGTTVPLTSWQRLWYNNREHWLHSKINQSRLQAKEVMEELKRLKCPDRTLKDIALIQSFVTEHVSLAYRSALKNKFKEHEFLTPENINPLLWILGWVVNLSAIGFCLYWVLAWGITNTGSTLSAWRTSYIVSVAQDIFLYEVTKMAFKFVFTLVSVRPQLSAIRQVINEAALSYIQYGPPKHQSKSEITIVQHFSPSCRAASMGDVKSLAAAAILRQISDADYEKCQQNRSFSLSTAVFMFMFVMSLVSLIREEFEDTAMDPAVQAIWSAIFVALAQIDIRSPTTVIVLVLVGSFLYLYYTFAYPDVMKAARNVRRGEVHFHHVRHGSHQYYEHQRHLRQAHYLPWKQRWAHEFLRGYLSLKGRVVYYWSLLQYMCSSEYWTYSDLQRSYDDSLWMEANRFAVLRSVNATGGTSPIDELLSLQQHHGMKKQRESSTRDGIKDLAPKKVGELFARKQNSFFRTSMVQRVVQKKMLGRIPDAIMAMRPTGGAPVDLGLEMRRAAHKAWLMGKVLEGVEGGLAELHGNAFIGKGGNDDQRASTDQLVAPTLYANKPRAYAAPHIQCDITTDKDKALRLILVRLRRIEGKVVPGDSEDATFCSEKDIKNYYVTFEELIEMVEWVWNVYSPGGLPLSLQERKEAREEFDKWQLMGRYWATADDGALMEGSGGDGNVVSWSAESQPMIPSPTAAGGRGGGSPTLDGRVRLAPLRAHANQPPAQARKQSLLATYDHFTPVPLSADIAPLMKPTESIHPLVPSAVLDKLKYYNVAISRSSKAPNLSSNEEMLLLSASQRHIGLPGKDEQRPKYITLAVSFLEFRFWFLHMTTHIERLREVVPKVPKERLGTKKSEEMPQKHSVNPLSRMHAATGAVSRLSGRTFAGSATPSTVLPLVHVQVSQTIVDSAHAPAVVSDSRWDALFLVGFFVRWYRSRQADKDDWTTRKPVTVMVSDSAYFRSVLTAAVISVLPFGSTVTITSVTVTTTVAVEYIVASNASASALPSLLLSGVATMTAVLQKSYPTATVAAPTVIPVANPALAPTTDHPPANSTGSTLVGFFTRWNQSRQNTRVFISPDIPTGVQIHGGMHKEDEELGNIDRSGQGDDIVSIKETVEPDIQLPTMTPDTALPSSISLSLAPFPSVNAGNDNIATAMSPHSTPHLSPLNPTLFSGPSSPTMEAVKPEAHLPLPLPTTVTSSIPSPQSVPSSTGMQQLPTSSSNVLRALGLSSLSNGSQVELENRYCEISSFGESSEVDVKSSSKMPAAVYDTTGSPTVPVDATHSRQNSIVSIGRLISNYLESGVIDLQSRSAMGRQPSNERSSFIFSSSEMGLLNDFLRPGETTSTSTSAHQDPEQEECTRQEVEVSRQNLMDRIEKLISRHLESNGADLQALDEREMPIGESSEVDVESSSKAPAAVTTGSPTHSRQNSIVSIEQLISNHLESMHPSERTAERHNSILSIERMISNHLNSDDIDLQSRPALNKKVSDLMSSCRLTSSERWLLNDLLRPGESTTTSISAHQDPGQEECQGQEVEAIVRPQEVIDEEEDRLCQAAALDQQRKQERLLEEERRRVDELSQQAAAAEEEAIVEKMATIRAKIEEKKALLLARAEKRRTAEEVEVQFQATAAEGAGTAKAESNIR